MSSQVLSVADFLPASPLAKGERIEVRGSLILIINVANPYPTLSLGKGEANIVGMS
jgi:hypothetical protein